MFVAEVLVCFVLICFVDARLGLMLYVSFNSLCFVVFQISFTSNMTLQLGAVSFMRMIKFSL